MGGIAQQHDAPDPPVRQRLAVVERLAQQLRRLRDDGADGVVPAGIFGQRILDAAFGQPGLARRLLRAADADPVEGPPGRHVVLHDAAVRSHPDAGDLRHIEMRDALGRHQPAPGDVAGVARQLLAEHLSAHRRMDAVGADQNVAGRGAAIGERQGDAVAILIEALDARAEAEAFLAETAEQDVEQVGAVRGVVRRTEMRFRALTERRVVEAVAGVPGAIVAALRIVGDARQRIAETERPQDARCIAADLEAGTDLAESRQPARTARPRCRAAAAPAAP